LLVVPACRPQDYEEAVAVLLDLRALVRLMVVLDRQVVQAELPLHGPQLLLGWLEEPDPDEGAVPLRPLAHAVERDVRDAASGFVRSAVDDHPRPTRRARVSSRSRSGSRSGSRCSAALPAAPSRCSAACRRSPWRRHPADRPPRRAGPCTLSRPSSGPSCPGRATPAG